MKTPRYKPPAGILQNTIHFMTILMVVLGATTSQWSYAYTSPKQLKSTAPSPTNKEPVVTTVIEAGPFALNCRFHSGEGPGRISMINVGDLIATKKVFWFEPNEGIDNHLAVINTANKDFNSTAVYKGHKVTAATQIFPTESQIVHMPAGQRLYWCKGAKLELIDEKGKVMPTAEFLCHSLIGFNGSSHSQFFPGSSAFSEGFIFNFSQGITNIMFPDNFGIPLNTNENLRFEFKALNRTSDRPRRIKCRWTMYFVADQGLTHPIRALNLFHSGVAVLVGGDSSINRTLPTGCGGGNCASVHGMTVAKDAPNDVLHRRLNHAFDKNSQGQEITWHWVVPPGRHSYRTMHSEYCYGENGAIRAAGAHLHPFCEKISLIEVMPGRPERTVFTLHSRTDTSRGIRIAHIDFVTWPNNGIILNPNAQYGWNVTYNNTSRVNQDAMAGVTLYFCDSRFRKPSWALHNKPLLSSQS